MRKSRMIEKLNNNEPVLITGLHYTDPSLWEMTSLMGFDGIWMDLEHHSTSDETASNLLRATRVGGSDVIVRIAKGEFMRMQRMLEAGAHAIMYPRCNDAAEAAEVVKWAKFAPMGQRGFDGAGADAPYCSAPMTNYIAEANDQTLIVIQLEDQGAVDAAEEIAAVPGVDALMFGPADFSVLGGIPGQFDHPRVQAALAKVAQAARNQGKHWGTPSFNDTHCSQLMEMGALMHYHMADIVMIKNGLQNIQSQFAPLGFSFDNRLSQAKGSYLENVGRSLASQAAE